MLKPRKEPFGRPTKYSDAMLKAAQEYLHDFMENQEYEVESVNPANGKKYSHYTWRVPYVEELALKLDIDDETIAEWAKIHADFSATIKRIRSLQRLLLMKMSSDKEHVPAGAIFQLKANHGMIETEKRILAGEQNEPLRVQFVSDEISND